jgi:rubrerythrin
MDTQFNVFEVLQIAEEVERKAARVYRQAAERAADKERRSTYVGLALWRTRHQEAWARIRREYSERTGEFGTFDPDNYVLSNPQVMAGLTWFGANPKSHCQPTGHETREQILRDAIQRSRGVIVFYDGLKEFARDPNSRMMIDNMISEEDRHCRLLARSLDGMRAPAGDLADSGSPRLAEMENHR